MGPLPYRYFEPEPAARLGTLPWIVRTLVDGFAGRLHRNPRPHTPGNDLRHRDSVAMEHTDRLLVKRCERQTHPRAHLLPANQYRPMKRPAEQDHHTVSGAYS